MSRHLVLLGSGETTAAMVPLHRQWLADVPAGAAVQLDTTFGFQLNADELTERIGEYFRDSVGTSLQVASLRRGDSGPATVSAARSVLADAVWAFAGPGSPTYAQQAWRQSGLIDALHALLSRGTLVLSSAAAMTAGSHTMPVYEMYKVGADAHWHEGIDVLGAATGLRAAVIAHFDNADGGTHDTRFCFVGETRFRALEALLPDDVGVLGIDEHTGVDFDLEAGTATVFGRGGVTLRSADGRELVIAAGDVSVLEELVAFMGSATRTAAEPPSPSADDTAERIVGNFAGDRIAEAVAELMELDAAATTLEERRRVHDIMLLMSARAERMNRALHNETTLIEVLVALRDAARADKRWADSDRIRDALAGIGVTVRDGADGSVWSFDEQ